jgi:uncharacterized membrane protein (DUF485 family)
MQQEVIDKIKGNPKYQELVSKRTGFAWILAALMLIVYYSFILTVAFAPQVLGTPLSEGSIITIGIPIGIGVILFAFLVTGIYVFRANGEFDRLTKEIKEELK